MTKKKEKHGLLLAVCMIIGTVIGSGVFFKSERVLQLSGGNALTGVLAWLFGGMIMIVCARCFALIGGEKNVTSVVDYADSLVGKDYGYFTGWFLAFFYNPANTAVLSFVSARYMCVVFGIDSASLISDFLALVLLSVFSLANFLTPRLSEKFQIAATFVKIFPLVLMAVVGTIKGASNGILLENFSLTGTQSVTGESLFTCLTATAFAYEGWIMATGIGSRLKNPEKTLPRALVLGTAVVIVIYIAYFTGLMGSVSKNQLLGSGEEGIALAFTTVFSSGAGSLLFIFVLISCLGALNGITLGSSRSMYVLAQRDGCPLKKPFTLKDGTLSQLRPALLSFVLAAMWLVYFCMSMRATEKFAHLFFDSSELPIVTIYALYVPIFISMLKKGKSLPFFKGKLLPVLAILASGFMVFALIYGKGIHPLIEGVFPYSLPIYLALFILVMNVRKISGKVKK